MKISKGFIYGFIFFILSSIVTYYFYYQSTKSELIIAQEYPVSFIKKPSDLNDLQIIFKKDTVQSLSKVVLRIINNSNKSITNSDFITPLIIKFKDSISILSSETESFEPKNISSKTVIDSTRSSIIITFDLLNPDDELSIGVLYEGNLESILPYARIKGIKNIDFSTKPQKREAWKFFSGFILLFLIMGAIFWIVDEKNIGIIIDSCHILKNEKITPKKFKDIDSFLEKIVEYYPIGFKNEGKKIVDEIRNDSNIRSLNNAIDFVLKDLYKYKKAFPLYIYIILFILSAIFLMLVLIPLTFTGEPGILNNIYIWKD